MNRRLSPLVLGLALGLPLMLGGCGKQAAPASALTASGEVLPGSVSDAMLNTDRSQSEAPLAPPPPGTPAKADIGSAAPSTEQAPEATAAAEGAPSADASPGPNPTTGPKPPTT
jgi:hypothetical protein